jgi:Tol biopolymer transport system component
LHFVPFHFAQTFAGRITSTPFKENAVKVQTSILICFSILFASLHTVQAQGLSVGPAKAIGVDIADTPLNRPSPDQKNYFFKTPQTTDNFFPSLLGLYSPGGQMIRTKYFNIYFGSEETTARQIADFCDDILENLMKHYPTFIERIAPIHVVVNDQADFYGNAFAVYSANYIHFWTNPLDWELRGTSDWVRNTFVHELTHIVSMKAAHKGWPFQIAILNTSRSNENPDFNFTLGLYHIAVSAAFSEGVAQFEAEKYGDERWDSHRDMILRMATLENDLLSLTRMGSLGGKHQFHGEQVYNQGYAMLRYIDERFGAETVRQIFENKPTVNFNSSLKKATGISAKQLYRDWQKSLEEHYGATADSISNATEREGQLVLDIGSLDYHPAYSPNGEQIAFITNEDSDYFITQLKVMDLTTKKVRKIADGVDMRVSWTASGDSLIYTKAVGGRWDTFAYDFKTKKESRLTVGLRGKDPDISPDGKQIVYVNMNSGNANIGIVNVDGTNRRMLTNNNDATQYYGPKWSPDGKEILFSIFRTAEDRDIAIISADTSPKPKKEGRRELGKKKKIKDTSLDSLQLAIQDSIQAVEDSIKAFPDSLAFANNSQFRVIINSRADERDPVWLHDGSGFIFSSDRTGIFNLYTHDIASGTQKQITNVVGGAFVPTLSPDGNDVIYAGYHAANYNLYRISLSDAIAINAPEYLDRDYNSIYTGKKLAELQDIGRYSTRMISNGITPIVLLGPTFIGNRFGLDQISAGAQASWGNLLGNDNFYANALIGKNFKRQQDFNSDFAFFYENGLPPVSTEQRTYAPRIWFGGSRSTINSIVNLGTVFAQQDTQSGTLVTNINGQQVLIPNATQVLKLTVTEEDDFKDVFNDATVGLEMSVGRGQNLALAYGYRSYSENLKVKQVVYDSTRIYQTNSSGQLEDITDQVPGIGGSNVFLDDFLYKDLNFFRSHEWILGWSYITLKPRTDTYINPSGGRALSLRYRRINATVTDSLAFSTDLNQDNIPDATESDLSPSLFREDQVQTSFNEYIASYNEFIPLIGRSTFSFQGFVAYKDGEVKEVQQNGGTYEGVFYYPLRYYLGGIGTLRGYPYFSASGSKLAFFRANVTIPLFKNVGSELPPFFFDKIYASIFFEAGGVSNADRLNAIDFSWQNAKDTFLADWGVELRFQMFSHYRIPAFGYFIMAMPTKRDIQVRNAPPGTLERIDGRRIYFGLSL